MLYSNFLTLNLLDFNELYFCHVLKESLLKITTKSMEPAGIIILLTGAGGVFKQVLINTGTEEKSSFIVFTVLCAGPLCENILGILS